MTLGPLIRDESDNESGIIIFLPYSGNFQVSKVAMYFSVYVFVDDNFFFFIPFNNDVCMYV